MWILFFIFYFLFFIFFYFILFFIFFLAQLKVNTVDLSSTHSPYKNSIRRTILITTARRGYSRKRYLVKAFWQSWRRVWAPRKKGKEGEKNLYCQASRLGRIFLSIENTLQPWASSWHSYRFNGEVCREKAVWKPLCTRGLDSLETKARNYLTGLRGTVLWPMPSLTSAIRQELGGRSASLGHSGKLELGKLQGEPRTVARSTILLYFLYYM
jgi:hypothetical protein